MTQPITITATVGAYMTNHSGRTPADLLRAVEDAEHRNYLVGSFLTYSAHDMSSVWTRVGDAEIKLTLSPKDEMVRAAVKALQGQLDKARAEWLTKQGEIMEQINKLQALDYVEAERLAEARSDLCDAIAEREREQL